MKSKDDNKCACVQCNQRNCLQIVPMLYFAVECCESCLCLANILSFILCRELYNLLHDCAQSIDTAVMLFSSNRTK